MDFNKGSELLEHVSTTHFFNKATQSDSRRPHRGTLVSQQGKASEDDLVIAEDFEGFVKEIVITLQDMSSYYNQMSAYLSDDASKVFKDALEHIAYGANMLRKRVEHGRVTGNMVKGIKVTEDKEEENTERPKIDLSPKGNILQFDIREILHYPEEYEDKSEGKGADNVVSSTVELKNPMAKSKYINKFSSMEAIVMKDGSVVYKCGEEGCGRVYTSKLEYAKHYDKYHLKKDSVTSESDAAPAAQNNTPKETEGRETESDAQS